MRKEDGDAGFTLIDTLMSTVVMTIVMAVFTTSILSMYRSARSVEARSVTQTEMAVTMQRMDREVRYAVGISRPYGGNKYVDFLTVLQGTKQCVQLRVLNGVLARRIWTYQQPPGTAWATLTTGVTSATPFAYVGPTPTLGLQQLTVTLTAGSGSGKDANTATFTALNSSRTTGNDYCAAGRT
jgi:type II secretory pathway pseudopilin PulG